MLTDIIEMLRNPVEPTHRVFRKAAAISVGMVGILIYYRHVVLGFSFGKPILVTAMLALLTLAIFGIFGGLMAAGIYDTFLRAVGAQDKKLSITVFFVEWLFALTAPLLGTLLYVFISSREATF